MDLSQDDLLRRIERLERRLAELEQSVGRPTTPPEPLEIEPVAPLEPTAAAAENLEHLLQVKKRVDDQLDENPVTEPAVDAPPPPPLPPTPPTPPPPPPPPPTPSAPPMAPPLAPAAKGAEPDRGRARAPARTARAAGSPPAPSRRTSLEQLVGGKWMAWIGALVVVVAVAFFLSYAYEEGWWGKLSETTRCLLGAGFGLLMMAGGELALRRISRAASVGLYGAGIAILYLVSFGAFNSYGLISQQASFLLMGVVAIVGFAITLRTRFKTIGVLSILGGYATPVLLSSGGGHDLEVLSFLTMLLAISLGLSATLPREFRVLRYVAFGAHALFALAWLVTRGQSHWVFAVFFTSLWWAMLLAECTLAALRRQSAFGNVLATLLATAGYVTAATWILDGAQPPGGIDWLGPFTAGVGLLCAAVALQFGPGIDTLRAPPRTAMDKLAVALLAQFGVLLAVAVGLQFDGYGESIGWLAIALASVELARRLPSRGVGVFGLIVGVLATGRTWLIWGLGQIGVTTAPLKTLVDFGSVTLSGWALLTAAAVVAAHVAARRLGMPAAKEHPFKPWRHVAVIIAAVASIEWLLLWMAEWTGLPVTGAWLAGAIVLLALQRWSGPLRYLEIALGMLVATAGRWLLVDALLERAAPRWDPEASLPFVNPQMGLAVAIAVVGWWAFRIAWRRGVAGRLTTAAAIWLQAVVIAGLLFMLVALSFEVDHLVLQFAGMESTPWWSVGHVRQLALSSLWAVGGLAMTVLAHLLRAAWAGPDEDSADPTRWLRVAAFTILIATGLKWLIFDTLWWTVTLDRDATAGFLPGVNLQMLPAVLLAVGLLATTASSMAASRARGGTIAAIVGMIPVAAAVIVLWGLSFEIDRVIARLEAAGTLSTPWPAGQLRALWWTALWGAGGLVVVLLGRFRRVEAMVTGGLAILTLSAFAWLSADTLGFRLADGVVRATPVLNLQFGVGVVIAVVLALTTRTLWLLDRDQAIERRSARLNQLALLGLLAAVGLWMGSLEIDRAFAEPMASQAGLSIYWSLYGLGLIVVGFAFRAAAARYAGLALLSLTVVKVLFLDLSHLDQIWRIASFLVSGMLLIGTSIVYSKLSPRLLETGEAEGND